MLRPTFFHFGDDANCWLDNDEMMVGPDLLVAPVFADGARSRTLYLPCASHAQGWYDFWSGRYLAGGQTITVDTPLARLPLFVRAGALLPTTDTWADAAKTEESSRALHYYPAPPSNLAIETRASLFEDNGLQTTNSTDGYVVHHFHATSAGDELFLQTTQQGNWTLPYESIRVVLPEFEKRTLILQSSGVRLTR